VRFSQTIAPGKIATILDNGSKQQHLIVVVVALTISYDVVFVVRAHLILCDIKMLLLLLLHQNASKLAEIDHIVVKRAAHAQKLAMGTHLITVPFCELLSSNSNFFQGQLFGQTKSLNHQHASASSSVLKLHFLLAIVG
jgi:hypothetical protein